MIRLSDRGHVHALFAIVVLATALGSLTQTVMNSMLEGVDADFGVTAAVGQWLTTAYMLVLGVTVPAVTWLSQRMPMRALVLTALGVFVVGAAVSGAAPCFEVLLGGRVLQAVAAGITLPVLQSIAMTRFPAGQNATAMGIAGIAMGFAPNIGPLIGGALVDSLGWRSFYVILLGILAALVLATVLLVPRSPAPARDARLDAPSLVLSTLGFGGLLLGFSEASSLGAAHPVVWASVAVGAACLALFVRRQRRVDDPLIDLRIFDSRRFRASFVAQNLLFASFMGITLIVPLFVQNLQGGTALEAGIVFIPATVAALLFNPLAGFLSDRVGVRRVTMAAAVLLAAGSLAMAFMDAGTPLWLMTLMQTVRGIGVSSLIGPFASWGLSKLPREVVMDGSAFFATARQACASLGTAAMVFLVTAAPSLGVAAAVGYQLAFGLSAALAVGVLAVTALRVR
ncbi:DHA2 family efflux MFS transporter permease subunit [Enterorhabdus sp. P55]|uniref:DHA2 family efflux MFS transporter permease subunit n=1 Tax=Enterorhabdus sp. P55 TaxID=2304571 RepID=UPI00136E04CB|nr:DHA2 family efflux MFS transporter permease subunit [Enterorhabdus sp. P55]NBI32810.1 DHA2 family efflux MFS transporter permease subunit [Enterorhabdus sp. P55]